jgi:hypothetical protein
MSRSDKTPALLSKPVRHLPCCLDLPDTYLVDISSEEENQFLAQVTGEKFWTAGKQSKQVRKIFLSRITCISQFKKKILLFSIHYYFSLCSMYKEIT